MGDSPALLDRLTQWAHILPMNGESYRFRDSLRPQKEETAWPGRPGHGHYLGETEL